MNMPRPKWYNINDLAELWGVSVKLIEHYCESNQLVQSAIWTNPSISQGDYWKHYSVRDNDYDWASLKQNGYSCLGKRFVILKEVERFEEEHTQELPTKRADYLNPEHPYFSKELSDAVTAWLRTVKQNPELSNFKALAKKWLGDADYKGAALERLAVVVNPDKAKAGGAPKKK